jgi:hypothetical protein
MSTLSHKRAMYKLDENFQITGSVLDKKKKKRKHHVLTEERLNDTVA